jgi:hypothetical protein
MWDQVNQLTDGASPNGLRFVPQQVRKERDRNGPDPLEDCKRHNMEFFALRVEQLFQ